MQVSKGNRILFVRFRKWKWRGWELGEGRWKLFWVVLMDDLRFFLRQNDNAPSEIGIEDWM